MRILKLFVFALLLPCIAFGQNKLQEVYIKSNLLDLPFSKDFRSLQVLTSEQIANSGVQQLADLLQQVAGVDIRQRGVYGTQADLLIRGGSFEQTLLLVDGIKLDDAQTGHHTLNFDIPIQAIERIEIIKGPASRIYGQNAYTGAVNIITKQTKQDSFALDAMYGSYGQLHASATFTKKEENSSHLFQVTKQTSDGYRHNTDFDNTGILYKSDFAVANLPITFLGMYKDRKFGANGFYSTPTATEQYEEVQSSLMAFSTQLSNGSWLFEPKLSWRRNQDLYLFDRNVPKAYRNLHITNKLSAQLDVSYFSSLGRTKMGVDFSNIWIASNNLGRHNRFMGTFFAEQLFELFDDKFYITPGIAVSYYSDFDFHSFPGIDLGYRLNDNLSLYANLGATYRVPTYTDLYYEDPTTFGNEDLKPETALSTEVGGHYRTPDLEFSVAVFHRASKNLIDYIKREEEDLWEATNTRRVNTKGIDASLAYPFYISGLSQRFEIGYTFLEDVVKKDENAFSKYSINSIKHHFTGKLQTQVLPNFYQNIVYKFAERTLGTSYSVLDANLRYNYKQWTLGVALNNIFDTEYSQSNLVPMPGRNYLLELGWRI